jgi:hypothetical protein
MANAVIRIIPLTAKTRLFFIIAAFVQVKKAKGLDTF